VRLESVEAVVVGLSLRDPVGSAGVIHADKTTLFLKVSTDAGSGWGECAAYPDARLPDPSVEAVEPVVDSVVDRLWSVMTEGRPVTAEDVLEACGTTSVAEQTVAAALEMAILDVELREASRPLASRLGAVRSEVETGALVGIPADRDIASLLGAVGVAVEAGARRVRLKVEPGWEVEPVAAIRERWPTLVLQADGNGSFSPAATPVLRALDAFGLGCLEQPFAADDLFAHRELSRSVATPIGLDESLSSLARVREAVALGACSVACLKPGRLGGVFAAVAAAEACAEADMACFVGGFFESGLGRSVNAALAGRPEFGLPGDIGQPERYLVADPFTFLQTRDHSVLLSAEPGLGSRPRPEVLEAQTLRTRWVRRAS
jgi:O-succinylbenzoate synthase